MKVSVIIPLYEATPYIPKLFEKIKHQKGDFDIELLCSVTTSKDFTLSVAKQHCDCVEHVNKNEFNHGLTRHKMAEMAKGEYLLFLTQDALPVNDTWLRELLTPLISGECHAVYARQIPYDDAPYIEKLIRSFNYPDKKRICSKESEILYGRKNSFYSDTCSAISRELFFKLGGYNYAVPLSEESLLAAKLLEKGDKIGYIPTAQVFHSHAFSLKKNYQKYYNIGQFEASYPQLFSKNASTGEGKKLLVYLIKQCLLHFKIFSLLQLFIDMPTRYFGYRNGYNSIKPKE